MRYEPIDGLSVVEYVKARAEGRIEFRWDGEECVLVPESFWSHLSQYYQYHYLRTLKFLFWALEDWAADRRTIKARKIAARNSQ